MDYLLHEENFARMRWNGHRIQTWMRRRLTQIAGATTGLKDPNVSIIIRSRNDGEHIQRLFQDIRAQIFEGNIEIILVDTESRDNTAIYAKSQGAKIIHLEQREFSYPRALNLGFQATKYPWVVTLVGHSSLTNRLFLKSLTYWIHQESNLGGIYSLSMENWNASRLERFENIILPFVWKKPAIIKNLSPGIMGANCSIVKREVWERLNGYDERYAAGGEDRAFARSMLSHNLIIVREPLCSVFHSHGLSIKNSLKQWWHWIVVSYKAAPFETVKVHKRRPNLR